jgi:integrase
MLKQYIEDHGIGSGDRIFEQYSMRYSEKKIGGVVKDAFTEAGVQINEETGRSYVSPHWMRHQRNTRLRERYGRETAMQYMGHEDEDVSDDYTHYNPDDIQGLL